MVRKKLKDWYDEELAEMLGTKIKIIEPSFDKVAFTKLISEGIPELEMKDRESLFAQGFKNFIPGSFTGQIAILIQILGPRNPKGTGMFTEFYWVSPIAKFIENYGQNDFQSSMHGISEVTQRNTGEYAIRPFLEQHPEKTYHQMIKWSKNDDFHLRRLSCEGLRPRLPWARKLPYFVANPTELYPVLDRLIQDDVKYVQKSVANCINDVLKDNEEIARQWLSHWKRNRHLSTLWIIKHALRNYRKKQIPWALELCDIQPN